jgi:hypothetical protein
MRNLWFIYMLFCMVLVSCSNPSAKVEVENTKDVDSRTELQKYFLWLLGEWHNITPDGHAVEIWKEQTDSSYSAISFFLVGKDTVTSETIRLVQRGNDIIYIPTVKGQNGNMPVEFKMTREDSGNPYLMVFKNSNHSFPQNISYERVSPTYMVARISGTVDGKPKSEEFPMIKK